MPQFDTNNSLIYEDDFNVKFVITKDILKINLYFMYFIKLSAKSYVLEL